MSRRKKITILAVFAIGLLLILWFKLPFERTYTASLVRSGAEESPLYGQTVDVTVHVRVQRYFLRSPTHSGTVTVEGDTYSTVGGNIVPTYTLSGAFENTDSFTMVCSEWQGNYLRTRCVAQIEDGQIVEVYLRDKTDAFAGRYIPADSSR